MVPNKGNQATVDVSRDASPVTREELLPLYRQMMTIRRFEEESARAYAQGKIGGFLHLYIGQEAIAVGSAAAIEKRDYVFQSYRDHGTALALGMSPKAAMAELFGKDSGCARGLGGSMHFFDLENNFYGGWGIVGGHIPLAAGAAFKSRYTGEDRATLCFFGEGAINIAGFHEGMHLAGLWQLPAVFICENNEYAMGTPLSRSSRLTDLVPRAKGYAMEAEVLDGQDVLVVRDRVREAVKRARQGEGPTFLEIKTYRFRGHSISDPAKYRTKEEVEERKKRDPVLVARHQLLELGVAEAELDDLDEEVDGELEAAIQFADESEPAKEEAMMTTVYASPAEE